MEESFKKEITVKDNVAHITLQGKLDKNSAPALKTEFVKLNKEGVHSMKIMASEVNYIDTSGLSCLLIGNRLCKDEGGMFIVSNPSQYVTDLIKIAQIDSIMTLEYGNAKQKKRKL